MSGAELIAAERQRQIEVEGWTPEHDDLNDNGEMAVAAACYAANTLPVNVTVDGLDAFPWSWCDDKRGKHSRLRELVIAGALIAAEIDRLQRSAEQKGAQ